MDDMEKLECLARITNMDRESLLQEFERICGVPRHLLRDDATNEELRRLLYGIYEIQTELHEGQHTGKKDYIIGFMIEIESAKWYELTRKLWRNYGVTAENVEIAINKAKRYSLEDIGSPANTKYTLMSVAVLTDKWPESERRNDDDDD